MVTRVRPQKKSTSTNPMEALFENNQICDEISVTGRIARNLKIAGHYDRVLIPHFKDIVIFRQKLIENRIQRNGAFILP